MESYFGGFDPISGFNLIVLLTICYPRLVSVGRLEKPIKCQCQGSKLRIIVSGMKFAASEVKRMQLCREKGRNIRMK